MIDFSVNLFNIKDNYGLNMSKILEFAELLMTKFCHDIASQIGAVNNGIEFLEDADQDAIRQKALELIAINGKELAASLKFFRFAYGRQSGAGETDMGELRSIIKEFFEGSKIQISFDNSLSTIGMSNTAAKLFANLIYISSSVLLSGGEIKVKLIAKESGKTMHVEAIGNKIKEIDDIKQILDDHEQRDIKLNNVHIHLAAKLASAIETVVHTEYNGKSFEMMADFI